MFVSIYIEFSLTVNANFRLTTEDAGVDIEISAKRGL